MTSTETEAPAPAAAQHHWWDTVRDALRGGHHDYTSGSLGRAIILLAVPMVMEMIMESIFAVVDVFFVARLGPDAVATVGLTESMITMIYTVAMGLGIGVMAMVARRIGEQRPDDAADTAVQGIALGLFVAAVVGVVGVSFAPQLLGLMGASPSVIAVGVNYTRVMLGGNGVILLLFLINAIFRGSGDAAIAMRVLWLANGINIFLAPSLIYGVGPFPELGVTGAAIGTTIGRGVGVLFALWNLSRPGRRVEVRRRHLVLHPKVMLALVRLSGAGMFQVFVGTASWIGLVRIVSTFGSAAVAGYTIGFRVIMFALLPSWGLANAAATMVGQNLGAGRPDRAERAVAIAGRYNMVFLGLVGLAFIFGARLIAGQFTTDPAVLPIAVNCLRIVSLGFVFYAWGMVFTNSFNGAGDTWTPTIINFACFWLMEIPLAWFLAEHTSAGPSGPFWAVTIAFSSLAVVSGVVFRRGKWKLKKV